MEALEALKTLLIVSIDFDLILSHKGLNSELSETMLGIMDKLNIKDDELKKKHWGMLMSQPEPKLRNKFPAETQFKLAQKAKNVPILKRLLVRDLFNAADVAKRNEMLIYIDSHL